MKKILSLALALIMICAMTTVAFATEATTATNSFTITTASGEGENTGATVSGHKWSISIGAGLDADEVTEADVAANYYVVVDWTVTSDLVYKIGKDAYSWNITTDESTQQATGAGYVVDYSKGIWEGSAIVEVTVTNWSNRELTATIGFDPSEKDADNGVVSDIKVKENAVAIDYPSLTIDAASKGVEVKDGAMATGAASATATVTLDGTTIEGGIDKADAVIGVVTVELVGLEGSATEMSGNTDNFFDMTTETIPVTDATPDGE